MISVVASRYARALVDVVTGTGSAVRFEDVAPQLRSFEELIGQSHELRTVLLSPAVPQSKKRAVIAQFAGPLGLSPQVRNFLYVIIDHRRIGHFAEIREAFDLLIDEHLGFVRADIASAKDLTDAQRQSLEAELAKLSGKRIRPNFSVDPSLVGGVTARIGSTVYDGSVRGQLEGLRKKLAAQ